VKFEHVDHWPYRRLKASPVSIWRLQSFVTRGTIADDDGSGPLNTMPTRSQSSLPARF